MKHEKNITVTVDSEWLTEAVNEHLAGKLGDALITHAKQVMEGIVANALASYDKMMWQQVMHLNEQIRLLTSERDEARSAIEKIVNMKVQQEKE